MCLMLIAAVQLVCLTAPVLVPVSRREVGGQFHARQSGHGGAFAMRTAEEREKRQANRKVCSCVYVCECMCVCVRVCAIACTCIVYVCACV